MRTHVRTRITAKTPRAPRRQEKIIAHVRVGTRAAAVSSSRDGNPASGVRERILAPATAAPRVRAPVAPDVARRDAARERVTAARERVSRSAERRIPSLERAIRSWARLVRSTTRPAGPACGRRRGRGNCFWQTLLLAAPRAAPARLTATERSAFRVGRRHSKRAPFGRG